MNKKKIIARIKEAPYLSTDASERIIFLLENQVDKLKELELLINEYDKKYLDSLSILLSSVDEVYKDISQDVSNSVLHQQSQANKIIDDLLIQAITEEISS